MSAPRDVTVVIVVWDDYCEYLPEAVASALGQAGPPDVLVVDNASVRPLPVLPSHVDVVRSGVRLTVGAARNLALSSVRTPYVLFLDADDVLLPDAVRFLRARLERRPRVVSCVGRYVSWNPVTGERVTLRRSPKPIVFPVSRLRRLFALVNLRYNTFPVVGCLHRTAAVRDAGGFGDGDVGEDWILGTLLCFRGRIEFHERPTFLRRVHRGSLWYRPHTREELLERCRLLRERAGRDLAVPRWAKTLLPLLALVHERDVGGAARRGTLQAEHPLLSGEAGSGGAGV
ncbi:MAG TPA: glycosyltransferase family 2 protein [Gaiellaceae bacterium]|nr:glycosyltransferase family 2 protein [Gaiellaceae bacterium]HZT52810.1 glycosyltransferase family 2 protein [Gaiellaceae bacterium]